MVKTITIKNTTKQEVTVCYSTAAVTCTKQKTKSTCVSAEGGISSLVAKAKLKIDGTFGRSKSITEVIPGQLYPCKVKQGGEVTFELRKKQKDFQISHLIVADEKSFKFDALEINDDTTMILVCCAKDDENKFKVKVGYLDDDDYLWQRIADVCLEDVEVKEENADDGTSKGGKNIVNGGNNNKQCQMVNGDNARLGNMSFGSADQ